MIPHRHDVVLHVNGQLYRGWKSVTIRRSMADLVGEFELNAANPWDGAGNALYPVNEFDACKISIDGETLLDGYVDDVDLSLDPRDHPMSIRGRDKALDLIDCSAIHGAGRWSGANLLSIARDLARPFGVSVRAATDVGKPFGAFVIQQGETAYAALERAARMRGVLVMSDGAGGLVITRAAKATPIADLSETDKALSFKSTRSARERFHRYDVKGQAQQAGYGDGEQAAQTRARAFDHGVPRKSRTLVLVAEDMGDGVTFAERARHEAAARRGRGLNLTAVIPSWRAPDGALWQPNHLVTVDCPRMRHHGARLIEAVTFKMDWKEGWSAELTLKPPETWDRLPEKEDKESGGAWT